MKRLVLLGWMLAAVAWGQDLTPLPQPVLEFRFDEPEKKIESTGTESSPAEVMGIGGDYLEGYGSPGSGVSQGQDDYCLKSAPGPNGRGSFALGEKIGLLKDARLLTLTFWIHLDAVKTGMACLFRQRAGGEPEGLVLVAQDDLSIACIVNDVLIPSPPFSYESALHEWTFVAVTVDANDLKKMTYYRGTVNAEVEELSSIVFDGEIKGSDAVWSLLAASDGTDPLAGKLDNFRLFDTALSKDQIEVIRRKDIARKP